MPEIFRDLGNDKAQSWWSLSFHFTPLHCSWMNQVAQWFSILQCKRLRIADFADKTRLAERLMAFVSYWNKRGHPFYWSTKSVAKVVAKCQISRDLEKAT